MKSGLYHFPYGKIANIQVIGTQKNSPFHDFCFAKQ